jgi:hypothetical protein
VRFSDEALTLNGQGVYSLVRNPCGPQSTVLNSRREHCLTSGFGGGARYKLRLGAIRLGRGLNGKSFATSRSSEDAADLDCVGSRVVALSLHSREYLD